jgi:predicted MPP superfamily phosphohydrolase
MFVSRGVGTVYVPVRINCPPEVAVLTLQREGAVVSV